jgi:hypothetical protein
MIAAREFKGLSQRRQIVLRTILANLILQFGVELVDGIEGDKRRRRDRWRDGFRSAGRLGEH